MKSLLTKSLIPALLVLVCLVGCASESPTPSPSPSPIEESPSPAEPSPAEPSPLEPSPVSTEVAVGDVIEYKMAFYLDEADPSNGYGDPKKFVQNLSNDFERIDDETLLNETDTYQLFWLAEIEDTTLTIPIEIPADGKYKVDAILFKGGDFNTCQIYIGDVLVSGPEDVDCFQLDGKQEPFEFGSHELQGGETDLVIKCTGKNEESAGYVFAINTLTLTCEEVL